MLPNPCGGALNLMFYNTDHFAEAGIEKFPETWDEMLEAAAALTQGDGEFLDRIGFNANAIAGAPPFITWLNANGQDWITDDLRTVTINNEAGAQTLEFMQAMTEINYSVEEQNSFWESAGEFDQMAIILDLVSIRSTGSWALFQLESHADELNYEVAAIPYGPMGSPDRRRRDLGRLGIHGAE